MRIDFRAIHDETSFNDDATITTNTCLDAFIQEYIMGNEEREDYLEYAKGFQTAIYDSIIKYNNISESNFTNEELNTLRDSILLVLLVNDNKLEGITLNDELAKLFNVLASGKDLQTGIRLKYTLDESNTVVKVVN